jgi:CheY-specific phosphatase CheX
MTTATEFNVGEHIRDTVPDLFETLICAKAAVSPDKTPLPIERISGAVGLAGDGVTGAVYLHLPEHFVRQAARAMLQGTPGANVGDSEMNDVVGELTNIVSGVLKSALCDSGQFCAVSTPSVIRGVFTVEAAPDLSVESFYFVCLGQRLAVEVHLKFY